MKFRNLIMLSVLTLLVTSCTAPKLGYFQDVQSGQVQQLQTPELVTIQPANRGSLQNLTVRRQSDNKPGGQLHSRR